MSDELLTIEQLVTAFERHYREDSDGRNVIDLRQLMSYAYTNWSKQEAEDIIVKVTKTHVDKVDTKNRQEYRLKKIERQRKSFAERYAKLRVEGKI
jgi:hypothetical protein